MAGICYQDITLAEIQASARRPITCAPAEITYDWGVADERPQPKSSSSYYVDKLKKYLEEKQARYQARIAEAEKQCEMEGL